MKKRIASAALVALACSGTAFAEKELKGVGVTLGNLGNPFFVTIARGAEQKAKEIGGDDVQVTAVSADYDLGKQVNQMDNFISAGVDMILVNAAHPEGILPAVMNAKNAGIVVIAVDVAAQGAGRLVRRRDLGHFQTGGVVDGNLLEFELAPGGTGVR